MSEIPVPQKRLLPKTGLNFDLPRYDPVKKRWVNLTLLELTNYVDQQLSGGIGHTHSMNDIVGLNSALNQKISVGDTIENSNRVGGQSLDDLQNYIATQIASEIGNLVAGAPDAYNTLIEIANYIAQDQTNLSAINTAIAARIPIADIVNNLTSNISNRPLSAAQGFTLKGLVDALQNNKANAADLNNLTSVVNNKADSIHSHPSANIVHSGGNLNDYLVSTESILNNVQQNISNINTSKGQPNGIASLDETGLIPVGQLPSFVDDVLEFASVAQFPAVGVSGKIYVSINDNIGYRWGGSNYFQIGASGGVSTFNNRAGNVIPQANDYTADQIQETANRIFVTQAEKTTWNNKQNALSVNENTQVINFTKNTTLSANSLAVGHDSVANARLTVRGNGTLPPLRVDDNTGASVIQSAVSATSGGAGGVTSINSRLTINTGNASTIGTATLLTLTNGQTNNYIWGTSNFNANGISGPIFGISSLTGGCRAAVSGNLVSTSGYAVNLTNDNNFVATNGEQGISNVYGTFRAAAGSANFIGQNVSYTINNTGAQTGNAIGLNIVATETNLNGMNHQVINARVNNNDVFSVNNLGAVSPGSMADAQAPNNSIYFSTTIGKLVYKNAAGDVNALY